MWSPHTGLFLKRIVGFGKIATIGATLPKRGERFGLD
jgi:hypothetical protein